jgi:hypothetical protein
MQKLALMMVVMMLGMSPVNGCNTSVDSGSQGVRDPAEMVLPPSTWFSSDREALTTERRVSSAASVGDPPVEPGGVSSQTNPATNSARDGRPGKDKE